MEPLRILPEANSGGNNVWCATHWNEATASCMLFILADIQLYEMVRWNEKKGMKVEEPWCCNVGKDVMTKVYELSIKHSKNAYNPEGKNPIKEEQQDDGEAGKSNIPYSEPPI